MRGVLTFVRYCIYIANYLDDWLICTPTEQQARSNTKVVLAHLQNLGLRWTAKKEFHCHQGSDIPRLEFEFDYSESISDSTEAVSVEGVPIQVPQRGAIYSEVGLETAWPSSQSGGTIGVASHAPTTAVVSKVQTESIRKWTATVFQQSSGGPQLQAWKRESSWACYVQGRP